MNSPYRPPATLFRDEQRTPFAIRLRGVAIFVALPLLGTIILQGWDLYINEVWFAKSVNIFEPISSILPTIAVKAVSGFALALQCARASKSRIVLLGIAVGIFWSLCALVTGNFMFLYFKFEQSGAPAYEQFARLLPLAMFLVPLAIGECALVRLYGKRHAPAEGNTR
ncbi:hypothetical protein F2P44_13120 [Massilia sp. CCM 8695]|uniref:DUF2798 domain-containing protein n=1 Tax=Massilia frigida TaxID=2609281 RepID=A0ABX0NBQ1_9BURK|nr:hypothetical protein [Massilia frigida]NHZ80209.1 hypothetical protein [Massilia frigida]